MTVIAGSLSREMSFEIVEPIVAQTLADTPKPERCAARGVCPEISTALWDLHSGWKKLFSEGLDGIQSFAILANGLYLWGK
jgi:hypothetical protein